MISGFRYLTDFGNAGDDKGKGGKYLLFYHLIMRVISHRDTSLNNQKPMAIGWPFEVS